MSVGLEVDALKRDGWDKADDGETGRSDELD